MLRFWALPWGIRHFRYLQFLLLFFKGWAILLFLIDLWYLIKAFEEEELLNIEESDFSCKGFAWVYIWPFESDAGDAIKIIEIGKLLLRVFLKLNDEGLLLTLDLNDKPRADCSLIIIILEVEEIIGGSHDVFFEVHMSFSNNTSFYI